MDLKDKRVIVVGLGASGIAAARLAFRRGARVTGTDAKPADALDPAVRTLATAGVNIVAGGHHGVDFQEADLVVVSPGVPSFPQLEAAERAGIPVIGEVELSFRALEHPAPVLAVGGTNGKSTVTSLLGALLEAEGKKTFIGGNLGEPLADHVHERFDAVVLEVSSFQMERVPTFRPRVSALLNVTDDHLDRYVSFDAYARAKGNAFVNQTAADTAVVPAGDEVCAREGRRGKGRIVTFGPAGDLEVTDEAIVDRASGEWYPRAEIALSGGHNASNVAAAIAMARELGAEAASMRRVLASFRGLPHRMALVAEIMGVRYYDDSKGTNVGATVTALRGLREQKAVLICGGRDKGGSYAPLALALRDRGRAAVLMGEAADAMASAIGDLVPTERVSNMDQAVRTSALLAQSGDAVLLSPACSSFDMFRDYKHRGEEFVRAVGELRSPSLAMRAGGRS